MIRFLTAASVAVIFAGALGAAADARSHDRNATLAAAETMTAPVLAADDAGTAKIAATQPYAIPEATRAELLKAEAASTMSPSGDLAMWGAVAPAGPHPKAASLNEKKTDQLRRFASGIISRTSSIAMSLTRSAMRFIGTPYVFGGTSSSGFDCSGYTQHVFAMLGIALPRTADAQFFAGHPTVGGLTTGDLVFFQTYEPGPSHVGIYIGGGRFIHSSSHGVMISALGESYWATRYLGAKRVANLR